MSSDEWLTPPWEATGRQYREGIAKIEATERRLKGNPAALHAFHVEQSRLFAEGKASYKAAHPGSGCGQILIGLLGLGVVLVALARKASAR